MSCNATVSGACEETPTPIATTLSLLHLDIIRAHILPRIDGCSLASVACVSPELQSLSSDSDLWSHICHSTWPSTTTSSMLSHVISSFPNGPRSFFSLSFPPLPSSLSPNPHPPSAVVPEKLISAVDISYRGKCIFSKVQETETVTGWFRCSPFRVDLLDPKESVATGIRFDDTCRDLYGDLELSWILIDPARRKAVNVSSFRPVAVERRWMSGVVQVRFSTVMDHVMCGVEVELTCVGGVLHVAEVCLEMEDLDGVHLNGKESLVILQRALEEKYRRGMIWRREEEGRRRYREYVERRRERRERKNRREGRLDMVFMAFGISIFAALFYLFCCST